MADDVVLEVVPNLIPLQTSLSDRSAPCTLSTCDLMCTQALCLCNRLVVLRVQRITGVSASGLRHLTRLHRLAALIASTELRSGVDEACLAALARQLPLLRYLDWADVVCTDCHLRSHALTLISKQVACSQRSRTLCDCSRMLQP